MLLTWILIVLQASENFIFFLSFKGNQIHRPVWAFLADSSIFKPIIRKFDDTLAKKINGKKNILYFHTRWL